MTSSTDAPLPALGELARPDAALIAEFRHCCEEWGATMTDRWFERAREAEDALTDRVSALVALAAGGATAGQRQKQEHSGKTGKGQLESRARRDATGAPARCICSDGFGMNLSCPIHKPAARSLTPERPADAP